MPRVRTEPRGFACRAETGANLADAKYLGRCKLRLLELLLAQGLDAVFVDPGVLVLSPLYLESLVRMGRDLAVGSAWPSAREVATTLSPSACPVPSATPVPSAMVPAARAKPRTQTDFAGAAERVWRQQPGLVPEDPSRVQAVGERLGGHRPVLPA